MNQPLDILAFSPHPDDAEFGCGGSLLLAVERGLRVAIADLSLGESSSRGTPEGRERERQNAAKQLGLCDRFSIGLPDTLIGTDHTHRDPIITLIRVTRPRIVLIPYWEDRHPDHMAAGKLLQNACFFAGVQKVGTGNPYRPERTYYYSLHSPFRPSFVIDVSAVWVQKLKVVAAYQSQFQRTETGIETALSSPNFLRTLEARAIWFGAMIGALYGEAFYSPAPVAMDKFPGVNGERLAIGELPPYSLY